MSVFVKHDLLHRVNMDLGGFLVEVLNKGTCVLSPNSVPRIEERLQARFDVCGQTDEQTGSQISNDLKLFVHNPLILKHKKKNLSKD